MFQAWRIALCITDLAMGGAERALAQLAVRLDRGRFVPMVISLAPPPPVEKGMCVQMITHADLPLYFLHARSGWHLLRTVHQLAILFRYYQVQLVQSFLFHANMASRWAVWWLQKLRGICRSVQAGHCRVVAGIRVAERARRWHLWLERCTHRWVDQYVCVSQDVAQFMMRAAGIPCEKIAVIPNGIAWEDYPARRAADCSQWGIPPGRKLLVAIGRLEEQKGFRWLVSTARQWLGPLGDCHLLIVGDGPQRRYLEALAARQGMAHRIHFAGFRPDVPEILAASSLLLLPSRWEGMPNVVMEAMASGLPVVATQVEGLGELFGPLAAEQTILYGHTEQLAHRVAQLLGDEARCRQLGFQNQQRIREHFSLERMVQAYQELWTKLLTG